jgi:tryptophan halogenase
MKNVVIVGGGFAGWYTALALNQNFPDYNITVIDSKDHPRLGVGETLGWSAPYDWKRLLHLGDDRILMWETGSIYKYGISATNFYQDNTSYSYGKFFNLKVKSLARFFSEFTYPEYYEPWSVRPGDAGLQQIWFNLNNATDKTFDDYTYELNEASFFTRSNKAPYTLENEYVLRTQEGWSYHIDAETFVQFLKSKCNNVTHRESTITDVVKQNSNIEYIVTDLDDHIHADMFIDCSGFQRVLVKHMPEMELTDWHLPTTNSAWVCPTRYQDPQSEMCGGTQIYGEEWGWRFKVNLYHRAGNGCVFNSTDTDHDIVRQHMQTLTQGRQITEPKLIQWKPAYVKKPWVGNVLALGIASYFIDPFDAPTFDVHSRNLEDLINGVEREEFNTKANIITQERNYRLLYNFSTSKRSGVFWDQQRELFTTEAENTFIQILENQVPGIDSRLSHNWYQMYYRMCNASGFDRSKVNIDIDISKDDQDMAQAFFQYNKARNKYIETQPWPNYYEWLKENRFNGKTHTQVLERIMK